VGGLVAAVAEHHPQAGDEQDQADKDQDDAHGFFRCRGLPGVYRRWLVPPLKSAAMDGRPFDLRVHGRAHRTISAAMEWPLFDLVLRSRTSAQVQQCGHGWLPV